MDGDGPAAVLGLRNETSSELLEQCDSLRLTNKPDSVRCRAHANALRRQGTERNGAHMLSRSLCDRTTFVALSSTNHVGACVWGGGGVSVWV